MASLSSSLLCFLCFLALSFCVAAFEEQQYHPLRVASAHAPFEGCACAGGHIPAQPSYMKIPEANSGAGCIGGCGGSPFVFEYKESNVQELKAWLGGEHGGIKALYVKFFNGKTHTAGSFPTHNPDAQITFKEGETIVGTIELCGNGIGSRLGHISFKTSEGQSFSVGKSHTPYYFNSGNSFLMGFFGQASSEVNHLGLLMMKSVKTMDMIDVKYPTIDQYDKGLSPTVYQTNLCNDDPETPQGDSISFEKQVGAEWDFSLSLSFKFGQSIGVSAGLPEIGKVKSEYHWEIGAESSISMSKKEVKTQEEDFPTTVPPRSRIFAKFSWWDSRADLPYTAKLKYHFSDGSSYTFDVSDQYSGVYITKVQGSYHTTKLEDGEMCDQDE